MPKFYYDNLHANQNITARSNLVWAADITDIELNNNKKIYIFLCIDIHTNTIVTHCSSIKPLFSSTIVKKLTEEMDKRFLVERENKLIIHTDRGTQFTSKTYNNFINKYEVFMIPSMSRHNTPTDNSVAERYMITFKEFTIDGNTLQEALSISEGKFRSSIIRKYVKELNEESNSKTNPEGSQMAHNRSLTASMLMRDPKHTKAFSEHFGGDPRNLEITEYKKQNAFVGSILDEIAARRAEIVDTTPFDSDDSLLVKVIDQRLKALYDLVQSNPEVTRKYVEKAVEPINDSLEELHLKIDQLLPKDKKQREIRPLRDPVDINLFPLFLANAGSEAKYKRDLKSSQLIIAYTILYHTGLRINEIRTLTRKEIDDAIQISQFNIIHHKTMKAHIHVLSDRAIHDLRAIQTELEIVFNKYQYQYLFGKSKPMNKKSLIRIINEDLKTTCDYAKLPFNIKSHSFRINLITNLLKVTSVHKVAEIIGHDDIRSTMQYQRYALSKDEIKDLLSQMQMGKKD